MLDHDEVMRVSEAMIKYGGSFVEALGRALQQADEINQVKIKNAFPFLWVKYEEMSKKRLGSD